MGLAITARVLAGEQLSTLPRRWAHVQGVAPIAASTARRLEPADADAIEAAAWLHDVGYSPKLAVVGFHPLDGARFASQAAMPQLVVSLIAYHSGATFEAEQRGLSNQLDEIAPPAKCLLDVLTFADMTTSPTGKPIAAEDRVAEILSRYSEDDPVFAAVSRSAPELLAAVDRVRARLDAFEEDHPR